MSEQSGRKKGSSDKGTGEQKGMGEHREETPKETVHATQRLTFRSEYPDVDSMGFVYYGVYADWFTRGRIELLRAHGLRYAELEENGLFLPVLRLECEYRSPIGLDEPVELVTDMVECRRTRLGFVYRVYRSADGGPVLCAVGRTDHAFIDARRRPLDVAKRFPDVWGRLAPLGANG